MNTQVQKFYTLSTQVNNSIQPSSLQFSHISMRAACSKHLILPAVILTTFSDNYNCKPPHCVILPNTKSVSIVTTLRGGTSGIRLPAGAEDVSPNCPDHLSGPLSLVMNG